MADNQTAGEQTTNQENNSRLTPELVQQVADKVYALWQRDLKIEQERRRRTPRGF